MSLPPSSMHIRSLYLPAPAASAALFCCKAWCSANLNPTLCVILIYRDAQCSTQDVSCLSSDLDRKEVMHVWKHRSTRLLYILQCDVLRRLVTGWVEFVFRYNMEKMLEEEEGMHNLVTLSADGNISSSSERPWWHEASRYTLLRHLTHQPRHKWMWCFLSIAYLARCYTVRSSLHDHSQAISTTPDS